jgi:hypothetical protein
MAVPQDARALAKARAHADQHLRARMRAAHLRIEEQVAQHRSGQAQPTATYSAAPTLMIEGDGPGGMAAVDGGEVPIEEIEAFLAREEQIITDAPEETSKPGIGTYIWVALMLFTMGRNCM